MLGPGEYRPDPTEGIDDVRDLPSPHRKQRKRNRKHAPCPYCGRRCPRRRTATRMLRDLGNRETGRPVELDFLFSVHRCPGCEKYFSIDLSDIADPGSLYTKRVVDMAVRYVVEDGSPYRDASWRLWRDHRRYEKRHGVPFATIQNWVEASGEKNAFEH